MLIGKCFNKHLEEDWRTLCSDCQTITRQKLQIVDGVGKEFIPTLKDVQSSLLNRPKFHLILHLPQCMLDFSRTSSFSTERYNYYSIQTV